MTRLLLGCFIILACTEVQAKTLGEYQTENATAKRLADDAQAQRAKAAEKRAEDKKTERDRLTETKKNLVAGGKIKLSNSGHAKIQVLEQELKRIKEQSFQVDRVSLAYLNEQKAHSTAYAQVISEFTRYKSSEASQKTEFQNQLTVIQGATDAAALIPPREKLLEMRKREISSQTRIKADAATLLGQMKNTYAHYERKIAPLEGFLNQYRIPKTPPPLTYYDRLTHIQDYAQNRGQFFSTQIAQKINQIEDQMGNFLARNVDTQMSEAERKNVESAICTAFLKTVNGLLEQEAQIQRNPENQSAFGSRKKLKPFHDFFQEVLVYQDQCHDLNTLRTESSPYFSGCVLLQPVLLDAQAFFETIAWSNIKTTLIQANSTSTKRKAPASVSDLVQRLLGLKNEVPTLEQKNRKAHLLQSIQAHDELLTQWEAALSDLASSEEGSHL